MTERPSLLHQFACFGLLDDAAVVLAVALLVLAIGWAFSGFSFEVEYGDPPPRDEER